MPQVFTKVNRALPSGTADGQQAQTRGGRFGEPMVLPVAIGRYALSLEGSYFKAINPTPGTGIAQTIQTSFLATNAAFMIFNSDSVGGKQIFVDSIRLINTVVGASGTRSEALVAIDNSNRFSSGGSSLTAVNSNLDSGTASIATVRFGALTLNAEGGSVRRLSRFQLRAAIMVQFEEWLITFGSEQVAGTTTLGGTTAQRNIVDAGPAVIGPGHSLALHLWNPGNAATPPSWEVEVGWWER